MKREVSIGFVPARRGFFSIELAKKMREQTLAAFKKAKVNVVVPTPSLTREGLVGSREEALKTADLFAKKGVAGVVIGAMNFGDEIPAVEAATLRTPGVPVMVFACKEEGLLTLEADRRDSFCGCISIATGLRRRGVTFSMPRRPVCFPSEPDFIEDLAHFGRVCAVVAGLRGARYGQIGPRPEAFETCAYDELAMLRKFGQKVIPIPLTQVFAACNATPNDDPAVKKIIDGIKDLASISTIKRESLLKLAKLEKFLREFVSQNDLDGLALQCWTSMQDHYGISACGAMARLSEERIPTACEVDIHGTMSMHALSLAADGPSGLADWNNQHATRDNVFSAWHCGVFPCSFARGERKMREHSIIASTVGPGICQGTMELDMRLGPVTLCRITESVDGLFKMLIEEGEVVEAEGETRGASGWVEVQDLNRLYRALLRDFPHHTAIAYGHVGRHLAEACRHLGMQPVIPNRIRDWVD